MKIIYFYFKKFSNFNKCLLLKIIVSKKDFYLICLHESIRDLTRFLKIIIKFHQYFIMFVENVKEFCSFEF